MDTGLSILFTYILFLIFCIMYIALLSLLNFKLKKDARKFLWDYGVLALPCVLLCLFSKRTFDAFFEEKDEKDFENKRRKEIQ